MVHNYYRHPGGEDRAFEAEAELLQRKGHEVQLFTTSSEILAEQNPMTIALGAIWSRKSKKQISQVIEEFRPDVAHFHNTFPVLSPSVYTACKDHGVPVVQTLHNYRLHCPVATFFRDGDVCEDCVGKVLTWPAVLHRCYHESRMESAGVSTLLLVHRVLRTWAKNVDVFIAPSEFARRKLQSGYLAKSRFEVKSNFVASDPGAGQTLGNYVLYVGSLLPEKGIFTLLDAWKQLEGIPLKVVGDGPLLANLWDRVNASASGEIEVLGPRPHDEVLEIMRGARFLAFPTRYYEVCPNVVIEAFSCGLPVFAPDRGAIGELVRDGITGFTFDPTNVDEIASKIRAAWGQGVHLEKLRKAARHEFEAKYTADANYQRLKEIYDSIL